MSSSKETSTSNEDRASARPSIRLHLMIILIGVAVLGTATNRLLLKLGFNSMLSRNSIVMLISYFYFFVLIRVWLAYSREKLDTLKETAAELKLALEQASTESRSQRKQTPIWWDALSVLEILDPITILTISLGLITYWISFQGPLLLIDAAFEMTLSAGLVQASRKIELSNWYGSVIERTVIPFLVIFLISSATMYFSDRACPGRSRFSEVVLQCWLK